MFCPKCAAQNIEGASFCRVCGANIGLVPQALTGRLPESRTTRNQRGRANRANRRDRPKEPPSLEKGIVNVFAGLGFIVAALFVMWKFPGGVFWGWALFFPGFSTLGKGIAMITASQREQQQAALPPMQNTSEPFLSNQVRNVTQPFLPPPAVRNTGELAPQPPSVTEGTTRHLGAEAPTKHLDSSE